MSRRLAALALAALSAAGCDALVHESVARQGGADKIAQDAPSAEKGECTTCAKFRARPPSGINVPPSL